MFSFVLLSMAAIYQVDGHNEFVAFTAGQDTHLALSKSDTVPFSKMITNHDAQFKNGIFTCTVPGVYKFQVYALTKSGSQLFLEVYHNDVLAVSLWARTPSDYADAGNAVILNMQSGDTIEVKTRDNYTVATYGTSAEIYTTITGILLGASDLLETPVTAFSAALTQHQYANDSSPILYNTVQSDDYFSYDVTSGTYTAPSSGIYVFHFFSLARQNQTLWQELYHNGDYVCSIYGVTSGEYVDAGNTAILHLKAGDHVQVRAHHQNNIYGAGDQIYSTFSGYQLVSESQIDQTDKEHEAYFSAGLSSQQTFASGTNVVFDRVFTDHGTFNHYDHTTGEFTAPYSGFYEFNYHALGQKTGAIYLELYHNYKYVDALYSHVPGGYAQGSNAAVVEMDAGDVAYIRAHHSNALYGASGEVYCTFSGTLLHIRGNGGVDIIGK